MELPHTKSNVNGRWMLVVSIGLIVFACLALFSQLFDEQASRRYGTLSIAQVCQKLQTLSVITNLVDYELAQNPFDGACRRMDLMLPTDARVYMNDMLGSTNGQRAWHYNYLAYYLFPREVATSLDQPAFITRDGFVGQAAASRHELLAHGFDVEVAAGGSTVKWRPLRDDLRLKPPGNPEWFRVPMDVLIAFCLPLFTAIGGAGLGRLLFPQLWPGLHLIERLACGLGLGMVAVAALTLGLKLCGFQAIGVTLVITAISAAVVAWYFLKSRPPPIGSSLKKFLVNPAAMVTLLVLTVNFIAAGMLGAVESDAVGAWLLKAKIFHLATGSEIVRWFSEPRLAHGHLDYPTLVPALHAATFDSIGAVNEYVSKFWPAWMLLLLVATIIRLSHAEGQRLFGPSFFVLALVCLPAMRLYAVSEGGTMPMIFFVTLGLVECVLAQVTVDRARLGLGLTLLFGAGMAKFEGIVVLAAALIWLLPLSWARPAFNRSSGQWRVLGFCILTALPFLCLRLRIPALHYESTWAIDALHHPAQVIANAPAFILTIVARTFLEPGLATWSVEAGQLHWTGKFEGLSSLYHHSNLGLPWLALGLTAALWLLSRSSRKLILWFFGVLMSFVVALGIVFASFATKSSLNQILDYYTQEIASPRYLFPLLVAWPSIIVVLLFRQSPTAEVTDPLIPTGAVKPT